MFTENIIAACGIFGFLFVLASRFLASERRRRLPPGPPGLPFIGAALSMPKDKEWVTYNRWKEMYGDVVCANAFGQNVILLNESNVAVKALNKRTAFSSERPRFPMLEMMGFLRWNTGIMANGLTLHHSRKVLLQSFSPTAAVQYESIQTREVSFLLKRLLDSPHDFEKHLRRLNVAQIMQIFFGRELDKEDTGGLVQLNEDLVKATSSAGSPAAFLVNTFPSLRYWPAWLPGGGFQHVAKKGLDLSDVLLDMVNEGVPVVKSFLHTYISEAKTEEERIGVKAAAATSFSAGAETSTAVLLTMFLTMILFPDVQQHAHEELDRVLGGRLPNLSDKAQNRLPYITAILLECLRWAPPGSFGLPHLMTANDTLDGFAIPAGSIVMSNIWSILHDEKKYKSPMEFNPERFMDPTKIDDPRVHTFGYGRRSCPGRYLAENMLWLSIASILKVFDVLPELDNAGEVRLPSVEFTSGVMSRPLPFRCRIVPRSQSALDLLQRDIHDEA